MILRTARLLIAGLIWMTTTGAQATMVSYVLDRSDVFEDGFDYLSVTLSDEADEGMLKVTVDMLSALQSQSGEQTGIQAFSFNFADSVLTTPHFELPDGWSTSVRDDSDGAPSMYDVTVFGGDSVNPLTIYIEGLGIGDVLNDFAVLVTALPIAEGVCDAVMFEEECIDQGARAYFYGGRDEEDPPAVVPLPASLWLLGSGLLGMVSIARRRNSQAALP